MRCPSLVELPLPPQDKSGWPWTVESEPLPDMMPDSRPWPRISIVTPSYNHGRFIEETIRSVLLQGYPDLEYIIIDGGSVDDSVEIIRKYEPWLAYWVSEPDQGPAEAINKGLRWATGEIMAWLNSDDTYLAGALKHVGIIFRQRPELEWMFGSAMFVDVEGKPIGLYRGVDRPFIRKLQYWRGWDVPQPALFFRKDVFDEFGGLDESFHYAFDYEWVLRISNRDASSYHCSPALLATYRRHMFSKTGTWRTSKPLFHRECARAILRYAPRSSWLFWWLQAAKLAYEIRWRLSSARKAISSCFA